MSQQAHGEENHIDDLDARPRRSSLCSAFCRGRKTFQPAVPPPAMTTTRFISGDLLAARSPTPPPGLTTPVAMNYTTYYLDPTKLQGTIPVAQNTKTPIQPSATTPNQAILPSFTIEQWKDPTGEKIWGSNLAFPAPTTGYQWNIR